jgi:aryl-alcohol dehydrogenase-like predicted oxidoreductase
MGVQTSKSIKQFQKEVQGKISSNLKEAAQEAGLAAIAASPVKTGAFITSWTISDASNKGRSRSSKGKPRKTYSEAASEAVELQNQDLASLPDDITKVYLNQRAPHAGFAMGSPTQEDQVAIDSAKAAFLEILRSLFK